MLFCFLLLHWLAAATKSSFSSPGDNELGAAFGANISFTHLICHLYLPPEVSYSRYLSLKKLRVPVLLAKLPFQHLAHRVTRQRI